MPPMRHFLASQAILQAFRTASQTTHIFEELRDIAHFVRTFNEADYKAAERTIDQFRKDMLLLQCATLLPA